MREILFRGKRADNKEWIFGSLIDNIYGAVPAIITMPKVDDTVELEFEYDHVNPKTICQYTGLTDKNGVKIFEGDILCRENTRGIIKFKNGSFIFRWKKVDKYRPDFLKDCILNQYSWFSEVEVIGNIFDNPELMEGGGLDE